MKNKTPLQIEYQTLKKQLYNLERRKPTIEIEKQINELTPLVNSLRKQYYDGLEKKYVLKNLKKLKPYQHDLLLFELKWFKNINVDSIDYIIENIDSEKIVYREKSVSRTLREIVWSLLFYEDYSCIFDKKHKSFVSEDLVSKYKTLIIKYISPSKNEII